ncbi:MAG: hypothetical protein ACON3Z_13145 [Bradymonadia bacterium]
MTSQISLSFECSALADQTFFRRRLPTQPELQVPTLRDDVRFAAQRGWLARMRSEYIGVMVARRFWALLVDINAPVDIQELALTMVLDEQRHTRLCAHAAISLGAEPEAVFELTQLQQARDTHLSIHEQVVQMVVQTYAIGEVTAMGLVKHALQALPESGFRDTLKLIAGDEVLHARIGPALLQEIQSGRTKDWLPAPSDTKLKEWVSTYLAAMRLRDVVEDDEIALYADPVAAEQMRLVGLPDPSQFKDAYHLVLETNIPDVLGHLLT